MPLLLNKSKRRIFGNNHADLLRSQPRPVTWRLEVREDTNDRGMFLCEPGRAASYGTSVRLANYISAGGMRDLQPGRMTDRDATRRQFVIRLALFLLTFWLTFLLLPCE